MRILTLLILLATPAGASTLQQLDLYTSSANYRVTGTIGVAASTAAPTSYKFIINGPGGYLQFPDGTRQTTAGGGGGGGISTVTVNTSQMTGNGTETYPITLLSSSVTLQGNSFNGNNQLVKTNASGVIPLSITGSANSASVAAVATTALSASSAAYATTAASADYALAAASLNSAVSPIFVYPGLEINTSPGYAYNWIIPSTTSLTAKFYDGSIGTWLNFDKYGLVISSGIRAGASRVDGSGGVNIINSDGKIPAITSDYFASLDGSAITGLSTLDTTKVPLGGGTMTGSLVFEPTSISTGQIVFKGGFPHSIQFNNQSATSDAEFLGETQFLQSGTGKQRIISFGDNSATYPKELQIGADTTSLGANVRITGSNTLSPDLFVSSWTSVGVGTAHPSKLYSLDVAGSVNSTGGFFKNGVEITGGGSGGDNLGNHVATMTLTAGYGISSSTLTVTGSQFSVGGSTLVVSNGMVGIGMTPTAKLNVSGNISTTGGITSANAITTSSDVVAHAYYGDGSHLTGITGGGVQVATAAIDGLPIGTFINYGSTTPPAGYLYCNGVNYSTTTYADLFNVIGYKYSGFAVSSGPVFTCDFRGMFSRGVDEAKLRDSEFRVIGSTEADKMQGHYHNITGANGDGSVPVLSASSVGASENTGFAWAYNHATTITTDGTNGTPRTGTETRPMNVAVAVMVKYANVASVNISSTIITNGQANVWTGANTFSGSVTAATYYGDGSHLTGLAGGGDVFKASTQTFTGANTFTGSVTASSFTVTSTTGLTISTFSATANGFTYLPGGLLLQWGSISISANSTGTGSFPKTFPSACFSLTAAHGPQGAWQGYNAYATGPGGVNIVNTSQFQISNLDDIPITYYWQAIGY